MMRAIERLTLSFPMSPAPAAASTATFSACPYVLVFFEAGARRQQLAVLFVLQSDGRFHEIIGEQKTNVVIATSKRRTGHFISEPGLRSDLARTLGPRLVAEVRKAFFFDKFRFEAFRVGRYDSADGGSSRHTGTLSTISMKAADTRYP